MPSPTENRDKALVLQDQCFPLSPEHKAQGSCDLPAFACLSGSIFGLTEPQTFMQNHRQHLTVRPWTPAHQAFPRPDRLALFLLPKAANADKRPLVTPTAFGLTPRICSACNNSAAVQHMKQSIQRMQVRQPLVACGWIPKRHRQFSSVNTGIPLFTW